MIILFDIDDTLFPSTEFSALARKNAINAMISMGLDTDYETLYTKLKAIIENKGANYPGHFNDLCTQLKIADSAKFIAAAVAAYHDTKTAIQPFSKVHITLLKLKEMGCLLYVATNGNSIKQWDKLIRLGIALYFDGVFVSDDLGEEKGTGFYRKILKTLNARPETCIMVGDREDADILPAKKLGIKTVRVLSGKYASMPSKADFTIKNICEILEIVKRP